MLHLFVDASTQLTGIACILICDSKHWSEIVSWSDVVLSVLTFATVRSNVNLGNLSLVKSFEYSSCEVKEGRRIVLCNTYYFICFSVKEEHHFLQSYWWPQFRPREHFVEICLFSFYTGRFFRDVALIDFFCCCFVSLSVPQMRLSATCQRHCAWSNWTQLPMRRYWTDSGRDDDKEFVFDIQKKMLCMCSRSRRLWTKKVSTLVSDFVVLTQVTSVLVYFNSILWRATELLCNIFYVILSSFEVSDHDQFIINCLHWFQRSAMTQRHFQSLNYPWDVYLEDYSQFL